MAGLLNVLDVQLNASWGTEATSMALLEGMSLGLPTVASDYGGNPWVVRDGETGLIFPRRDPAALAGAMERLMNSPGERAAMGPPPGPCTSENSPEPPSPAGWRRSTARF